MTVKIAVAGSKGRMGQLIMEEIRKFEDLELVAGFDLLGVGDPLDGGVSVSDSSDLADVLQKSGAQVLIDFTTPIATVENVRVAANLGVNLVVGTTGFSEDQKKEMARAIEGRVAAVISPNFSVGVNLFWKLIEVAARSLEGYDIEVIEAHHRNKMDAPSGTAAEAVKVLAKATGRIEVVYGREGRGLRGDEIGVHAVRAGDIVGDHTVLFAGPGERLEIKHQAHSRQAFASGAVRSARWVTGIPNGIYAMADVLDQK
ncbi:MAG TPA: 4-hydroxy-tetrahydrodipicolinate reductase [Methanotrichaceae archaeon]|nr:4-hydroxy-tetrahydrodipicolinate reductase [Methanotrichaceae archaeon]